ncbi:MAG: hypothetical protein ACRC3J_05375 [Culicoidibacterales bacterium]
MSNSSKKSEYVQAWRHRTKEKLIAGMGGCCQICGYNKCKAALEFHHIDSDDKDFAIGTSLVVTSGWDKIITEVKKCILLCANCHREVHKHITQIPTVYQQFDESLIPEREPFKCEQFDECPVCGKSKPKFNITCSTTCAAKHRTKVDWNSIDLIALVESKKYTNIQLGEMFGCSDANIGKRYRKLKALQ